MDKVFSLLGVAYLLIVAWPLAKIDIREHRLPNRLVLPAFPVIILGQLTTSIISANWWPITLALVATVFAFIIGVAANHAAGLGMGDVKLIAAITLALAWYSPIYPLWALLLAFVFASAVILFKIIRGTSRLKSTVALGPYLLVGFVACLPSIGW